jgi:hypothetical protein
MLTDMDKIGPLRDVILMHAKEYSSDGADYSVTTLQNPPRVVHLNKRHLHKCDIFVKTQLASFIGTAIHNYAEYLLNKIPDTPYLCEERLHFTVADRDISGAYDLVHRPQAAMSDWKTTSVWKAMFGDHKDWAAQQNIYRFLYNREHNVKLKTLRIIAMFKDWSKNEKFRSGPKYPNEPALEYRMPLWGFKKTEDYMEIQVENLKACEDLKDDDLPFCSFEDMWSRTDQVAIKSTRIKKAVRVLSSQDAAENFVKNYLNSPTCKDTIQTLSYEVRPAKRTRCEEWCPVNKYCNQYQEYLSNKANVVGEVKI